MNAASYFLQRLPPVARRRVEGRLRRARWLATQAGDLADVINAFSDQDVAWLLRIAPSIGEVYRDAEAELGGRDRDGGRLRLWQCGALLETGGERRFPSTLQPAPLVVAGKLVLHQEPQGMWPAASAWPRPEPLPPAVFEPAIEEPEDEDALLAAATRLIGVPLGTRGRDKGAWGARVATWLGLANRTNWAEPDWRGDIEVKTVAIARTREGLWQVREDPAISVESVAPHTKLRRVLWIFRCTQGDNATVVSWYLQQASEQVRRLMCAYLHRRPKGPKGTTRKGYYLQKRFFAASGALATLNGSSCHVGG